MDDQSPLSHVIIDMIAPMLIADQTPPVILGLAVPALANAFFEHIVETGLDMDSALDRQIAWSA